MKKLNEEILRENINEIARFDIEQKNLYGSSYYVFQQGGCEFKKHYGYRDALGKFRVDDSTMYRIASMTKPITAIAMLILVERKLVALSDPVWKFLPEIKEVYVIDNLGRNLGQVKKHPEILHLLTHSSGFGGVKVPSMNDKDKASIKNTVEYFVEAGLDFEPFTQSAYSAFASFDVIAAVIEKVTGMDYGEFLYNEVLRPCDMNNTTFLPTQSQWEHMMTMHNKVDGQNSIGKTTANCVFEDFPCSHNLAGAGLAASIDDYMKFARMLLNDGETEKGKIVSSETIRMMAKAYIPQEIMPGNQNWGLGVRVITDSAYNVLPVGTYGWSGAFGSHFWIDPQNKLCAVYMKNSRYDGGAGNKSAYRFEESVHKALA